MIQTTLAKLLINQHWQDQPPQKILTKQTTFPTQPKGEIILTNPNPTQTTTQIDPTKLRDTPEHYTNDEHYTQPSDWGLIEDLYTIERIQKTIHIENQPLLIILETAYIGLDWEDPTNRKQTLLNHDPNVDGLQSWTKFYHKYGLTPENHATPLWNFIARNTRAWHTDKHDPGA